MMVFQRFHLTKSDLYSFLMGIIGTPLGVLWASVKAGKFVYDLPTIIEVSAFILVVSTVSMFIRLFIQVNGARFRRKLDFEAPPSLSEFVLGLFSPPKYRDGILGDFDERFKGDAERFGFKRARWLYRLDVCRSVLPLLFGSARRAFILAAKRLGFIALLTDFIHRHLG